MFISSFFSPLFVLNTLWLLKALCIASLHTDEKFSRKNKNSGIAQMWFLTPHTANNCTKSPLGNINHSYTEDRSACVCTMITWISQTQQKCRMKKEVWCNLLNRFLFVNAHTCLPSLARGHLKNIALTLVMISHFSKPSLSLHSAAWYVRL